MSNRIHLNVLIPLFGKGRLGAIYLNKSPLIPLFQRGRMLLLFMSLLFPLQSKATVCSVSASPVNFGVYNVYLSSEKINGFVLDQSLQGISGYCYSHVSSCSS